MVLRSVLSFSLPSFAPSRESAGDKAIDEVELDELACGTLIPGTYNPPL